MRACIRAFVAGVMAAALLAAPTLAQETRVRDDGFVTSFDGTKIAYTFFAPASAARSPVVFYTHGWAGKRERGDSGWVRTLLDNGYAVLTWDARGFGDSGGEANVDSQEFEVRDVRALIDYVAARPEVLLDGPKDPRMGMSGGSYAGGIQLMTASVDHRVDAIAPEIAWSDLVQSLRPNGVLKFGWGSLLYGAGTGTGTAEGLDRGEPRALAPQIHRGYAEAVATNDWSEETTEWFDARSTKHYVRGERGAPGLRAPTLVIQGISDTLFNGNEGIATYADALAAGVEARLVLFCGGHTLTVEGSSCSADSPTEPSAGETKGAAILAWFDRFLKGGSAELGAPVRYQLQDGTWGSVKRLPQPTVRASGSGTIAHAVAPTSGTVTAPQPSRDGFRVEIPVSEGSTMLGSPVVRASIALTGTDAAIFFKLLDVAPNGKTVVVDDQVTPVRVRSSAMSVQSVDVELAAVSWKVAEGHRILLEVAPSSNDHNVSRVPYVARIEASVAVPVVPRGQVLGTRFVAPKAAPVTGDPRGVLPATGVPFDAGLAGMLLAGGLAAASALRRVR